MKKILITSVMALLSCAAMAQKDESMYVNLNTGIATGYSFTNNIGSSTNQPSGSSTNNYSLGANVGYNFNQYLATEVGYNHLWLASNPSNSSGEVGVEDIAVKGRIPLGDVFSLYGRAGIGGYQNTSGNDSTSFANNIGLLYGAGAEWALNDNWALRAEDWSVTGLGENIIQFGVQFSF